MKSNRKIDISTKSLKTFFKKGYSLKEILFNGISLYYSNLKSYITLSLKKRGKRVFFESGANVQGGRYVEVGNDVIFKKNSWISVPLIDIDKIKTKTYMFISDGVRIGPNCTFSAANHISIGKKVLFGPNVTILDHSHKYDDRNIAISEQGINTDGEIIIEENCWFGVNSVVYANKKITIGKNSIIAANTFLNHSIPPHSLVFGNPAKILRLDENK